MYQQKILVPFDGSLYAKNALIYTIENFLKPNDILFLATVNPKYGYSVDYISETRAASKYINLGKDDHSCRILRNGFSIVRKRCSNMVCL